MPNFIQSPVCGQIVPHLLRLQLMSTLTRTYKSTKKQQQQQHRNRSLCKLPINHFESPNYLPLTRPRQRSLGGSSVSCRQFLGLRAINKPLKPNYPWAWPFITGGVNSLSPLGQTILIGVCVCLESIKIGARKMIDLLLPPTM